ncbi:MAG: pyridoxal 5'-phosphate synthase [Actinomycetia bacterium]|nr:pyridoxal 5'-phosphate synthase [Actinomycetes bacterium]
MSDLSGYPRTEYDSPGIDHENVAATPWAQIRDWVSEAVAASETTPGFAEPTAVSVATVDAEGRPNVRTVLARFLDDRGPGFVSSLHSTKAAEIQANSHIALSYTWPGLFRAIRFRGVAEPIEHSELLTYWRSRPHGSQIAASASLQSHPIESRAALEAAFAQWEERYPDTGEPDAVPMPEDFCGWRVRAVEVEFWAGRRSRLHDRIVCTRIGEGTLDDAASWAITRRQP